MKPSLDEVLSSVKVIALPMRTTFRGLNIRETSLIEGPSGWGEFAPFVEYDDQESVPWLQSAIESAFGPTFPTNRSSIPINGTIPALDDKNEIEKLVARYPGVKVFKVKVGTTLQRDLARIAMVRSIAPDAKIRIDVNGSWSVNDAVFNIRTIYGEIAGDALEYVEQPVATLDELKELKDRLIVDVKIAGDEVIRKAKDPFGIDLAGAIDVAMLKVAPLGGIERSLKIAAHHKLPVVVSSALESAVGIAHGLRLAAALPNLDFAAGLGTGALFEGDVGELPIVNGEMRVSAVTPEKLERFEISGERLEWWRNRIRNVWEVAA